MTTLCPPKPVTKIEVSTCFTCGKFELCPGHKAAYRRVGYNVETMEDVEGVREDLLPWQERLIKKLLPK